MKVCTRCKGAKAEVGGVCVFCEGQREFHEPQRTEIFGAIVGPQGLRKAKPTKGGHRAYYVWRLARFHGGVDVTIPMVAMIRIEGDPYIRELDELAEETARRWCGSDLVAASRWGALLGWTRSVPLDLPPSAYVGGPSYESSKPVEEWEETR